MFCCTRTLPLLCAGGLLAALLASAADPSPAAQDAKGKPAKDAKAAPGAATDFEVDAVHSSALFRIQHMGVSYFHGRFNAIDGHIALDAATPANSSVEIT